MAYVGKSYVLPLGENGLLTDLPETKIPPTALSSAFNIRFETGAISKDYGSTKFNSTALDSGAAIVGIWDWWPDGTNQRTIAITDTGKVFRDTGNGTFSAGSAIDTSYGAPTTDLMFVDAGNESASDSKKLFIFTGTRALGYLDGDATSITNATAASDWGSGNHPKGGFVFKNRLIAFGNANRPHTLYVSPAATHEDFSSADLIQVFPGEFDAIKSVVVYKGIALIFKKPRGVYVLQDNGSGTVTDWSVSRLDSGFGIASPHAAIQVLDDLLVGNTSGSIMSLKATDSLGSLKSGDILSNAEIEDYIRTYYAKSGVSTLQAIYYDEKKKAYFTLEDNTTDAVRSLLVIDMNKQNPRYSIDSRNQAYCLALRRDDDEIQRPVYGTQDGFVYLMDQSVQSVDGNAYVGEFSTPDLDFSFLDPALAQKNKLFDFIAVSLVNRDANGIYCDVFIDSELKHTIQFTQVSGTLLDEFMLDEDSLSDLTPVVLRKRTYGSGKKIRLRFYTSGIDTFQLENVIIDFRLGDEGTSRS